MARKPSPTPPPIMNGADKDKIEDVIVEEGAEDVIVEGVDAGDSHVDDGVRTLQEQLDEERRKRESAERERDEARQARQKDQREVADSRLQVLDSSISDKEGKLADVKRRIREAKEAGDYDAEVEAMSEMQTLNIELRGLKVGKSTLEQRLEDEKNRPTDDVDAYIESVPEGRAKSWLRDHRDIVRTRREDMIAAHYSALGKRLREGTDDYFEHVEQELGLRDREDEPDDPPADRDPPRRQAQPPAAPVSRGNGSGMGDGGSDSLPPFVSKTADGRYRLSAAGAEAAAMSGMTAAEYLEQALKLQKEGAYGTRH